MDRTNCRPAAISSRTLRARAKQEIGIQSRLAVRMPQIQIPEATGRAEEVREVHLPVARTLGLLHNESFPPIHPAPGRHLLADDRRSAGRYRRLPAASCISAAGSGLSDHPGDDLLPGRGSDSDGLVRHGTLGAAVRAGAWAEPDDLNQLAWQFDHYSAIQSRPEH